MTIRDMEQEETDRLAVADNEEIKLNTTTVLIREIFDGALSEEDVFDMMNKLEDTLGSLFESYYLIEPIENGCAHFHRKNWVNRRDPNWDKEVEIWNESNEPKIKA